MISNISPIHRNVLNVLLYILFECDKLNELSEGKSKMDVIGEKKKKNFLKPISKGFKFS